MWASRATALLPTRKDLKSGAGIDVYGVLAGSAVTSKNTLPRPSLLVSRLRDTANQSRLLTVPKEASCPRREEVPLRTTRVAGLLYPLIWRTAPCRCLVAKQEITPHTAGSPKARSEATPGLHPASPFFPTHGTMPSMPREPATLSGAPDPIALSVPAPQPRAPVNSSAGTLPCIPPIDPQEQLKRTSYLHNNTLAQRSTSAFVFVEHQRLFCC